MISSISIRFKFELISPFSFNTDPKYCGGGDVLCVNKVKV